MPEPHDEFYVGYLPQAPPGIARRARFLVVLILLVGVVVALTLVRGQARFDPAFYEFGVQREFTGFVVEEPYPSLFVAWPGKSGRRSIVSSYALVLFGKHGAAAEVAGFDGRWVRLSGELIYRDGQVMIQIVSGTLQPAVPLPFLLPHAEESLGEMTLVGEIVDSKCFLGVMKPGRLKPHRACAVRCISGGIPPVLLVRDAQERATYFWLVSREGLPVNRQVLDRVAEPVEIRGEVVRRGNRLLLRSDPATYRTPGS